MIYVHSNPSNIIYNDYIYVFLRSWYMPNTPLTGEIVGDRWMKLPALRTDLAGGRKHYTACNANCALMSMATIASDGTIIKVGRATPNKEIDAALFAEIQQTALNVESWESGYSAEWPYSNMFAQAEIKKRHAAIYGPGALPFSEQIADAAYNKLAGALKPKPCNCGKMKVVTK